MPRSIVVAVLCLVPIFSFGQTSFPVPFESSSFLQSGVMLGSGHERQLSLRTQAFGPDFSGIIDDQITDLYRNPAYFAGVQSPTMVGELVRPGTFNARPYFTPDPDIAAAFTGLRYAYVSNFGILLRGNYRANSDDNLNANNGLYPVAFYGTSYNAENGDSREDKSTWGDIQLSYGFTPASNMAAGVSYTFGLFEAKNLYEYFNNSYSVIGPMSYHDTLWNHNGTVDDASTNLRSHTFRVGFRWDKPDNQIEIIGTVEALNGTVGQNAGQSSESYETYRYIDTARPYVDYRGTFQKMNSAADVKGINARVDFRYHRQLAEGRTFTAQVGGGIAHFSAGDNQLSMSQTIDTSGQWYTSGTSSLSRWTRAASPDGSGFQANASAGWTAPFEPFLLAAATVINVDHIVYDYSALGLKSDTLSQIQGGRDSTIRGQAQGVAVPHSPSVFALRLAVPIAMEVEAMKGFHIRAGWVPQYVRRVNKDDSSENGFRETSDNLDASTMTFGIGYQILDKLRVDMVNEGDIAQPRTWNIAAQYTF